MLGRVTRKFNAKMMTQRSSLPTPIMPPILVTRLMVVMLYWVVITSTWLANCRYVPYLSDLAWNPVASV